MIKAIIFDYFGVLSSDEYWHYVGSNKQTRDNFHELADEVNLGEISWQNFISELADEMGKTSEEIVQMYKTERIVPQVVEYARSLHKTYRTALLTNAHHDFIEPIILQARLNEVFDEIFISSRLGVLKPDEKIFERALKRLAVRAEETVFIDDIAYNIEGAKKVGLNTILYSNLAQLKTDLSGLLEAKNQ